MALVLNLYNDAICKDIGLQCGIGVAGITGTLANKSAWAKMYNYGIYIKNGGIATAGGVVLSGATPIFNLASIRDLEILSDPAKALISDKVSNSSGNYIYNAFFAGIASTSGTALTGNLIQFFGSQSQGSTYPTGGIRFRRYTQTPADAEMQQRATWNYLDTSGYEFSSQMQGALERCIMVYKLNIWETDYYMFAIGVSAGGDLNDWMSLVLIPVENFEDKELKPHVGPVSKESAAAAYIGKRPKDSVLPRTLTNKNMLGFNANGVYLCKISESQYRQITSKIYNGFSGNIMNMLGQVVSFTVGGNDRRPYDEIQTMINGIICCHAVPNANRFPASGSVDLESICGYTMFKAGEMTLPTINRFEQWTVETGIIPRPTGAFLDFAPFTTVTLSIPVLGNVDLDASAILGNALKLYFTLDAFSGIIACDICIVESGAEWIYTTLHANCAVDMPIAGAGANANPLEKIAGGISSIFTGGAQNIPNAVIGIYDGVQNANYSRPISRVQSSNAMPVISPTAIYLTIATPDNYNAGDFWELAGVPSHMSGNVGDFHGFTVFEHVDLSTVSGATESELQEIENILYGGVWL